MALAAAPSHAGGNIRGGPLRTAKERLGGKASDEQHVDNCKVPPDLRGPKPGPERGGGVPGARPNFSHRDYSPLSCDVGDTQFGLVPRSRQDARAAVSRRGASPNWQELPRSAIANCEDRLKRSAKPCRENPAAALGSAFRWIAFVPLYRCRALLAGPVHDNKEARKHRPTA